MGFAHFTLFKYGCRVVQRVVKFCHPLHDASFCMFLIQNSLRYVNITTFESIICIFLFRTDILQRIKNKLSLLNLFYGVQRSHSETCSLKKRTLPYTNFVFKYLESKKSG